MTDSDPEATATPGAPSPAPDPRTADAALPPTGRTPTTSPPPEEDDDGVSAKAGEMKEKATAKAREVKLQAREAAEDAKETAREEARALRRKAEEKADRWTDSLGARTGSVARALRAASDSLREEGEDDIAEAADGAAEQVDRVRGYLRDEDPGTMLHDFEDLGRRNPAAFLGSAFALGLAAGRFLNASRPETVAAAPEDGGAA